MLIITFQSRLSIRLLAVCLILLPTATFPQLVCNAPPEGFDAGIPSGWFVTGTGGAAWSDLTACGEREYFIGGPGRSAWHLHGAGLWHRGPVLYGIGCARHGCVPEGRRSQDRIDGGRVVMSIVILGSPYPTAFVHQRSLHLGRLY